MESYKLQITKLHLILLLVEFEYVTLKQTNFLIVTLKNMQISKSQSDAYTVHDGCRIPDTDCIWNQFLFPEMVFGIAGKIPG